MIADEVLYPYSIPVDREKVVESGALTSLPVRIHRYNHLADAGALCLTKDWRDKMNDGQDRKSNGSPCIVGNWGSFIWPESEPERLGLLCYLLDAGCFHDGAF
jgi:ophiobolin F synthase